MKIKSFFSNFLSKFCLDKKFNNIFMAVFELPLLVVGLIFKSYSLILYSLIVISILNILIKKIYQLVLVKKLKKNFDINNKMGDDCHDN